MPTYEYRCKDCDQTLEVFQAFTDDALTECPSCHGTLRKVFGNVGITFKGSGFYKTDSRASAKTAAKPNGSSSDGSAGGSDGSAATKSESSSTGTSAAASSSSA